MSGRRYQRATQISPNRLYLQEPFKKEMNLLLENSMLLGSKPRRMDGDLSL